VANRFEDESLGEVSGTMGALKRTLATKATKATKVPFGRLCRFGRTLQALEKCARPSSRCGRLLEAGGFSFAAVASRFDDEWLGEVSGTMGALKRTLATKATKGPVISSLAGP